MTVATTASDRGKRLDAFLHQTFPEFSRSRLQGWIRSGDVLVDGAAVRPSFLLRGDERIELTPQAAPPLHAEPENIELQILYEDADLVAVDKPPGMVVHAGAGVHSGTLVNALLHRFQSLSGIAGDLRPGIVHRLDRFTTGVLLVAKNDRAHQHLAAQFASRTTRKIYLTLVHGAFDTDTGRITSPIARDPVRRERMTTKVAGGRAAWTEYQVLERYPGYAFLQVLIRTGRTHQIRVHMASIRHPVVGDRLYGAPESALGRYFLHSHSIEFDLPSTGERIKVESPLPADLANWKQSLAARF